MYSGSKSETPPDILLVDDNPTNLRLLQEMLGARGYTLRPVLQGKLGLTAARAAAPDLVLLDINMPEMNGYEVCEQLKADPELSDIPVIFLSALSDVKDKVKGFAVGGVDYISKPFQIEEVLARVDTHLELLQKRRELKESITALQRSEALREDLLHMMVHDLRSPLQLIIGYLGMLRNNPLPDYIERCHKGATQLNEMVNTMLDIGKMESQAMQLIREDCDLPGLFRKVAEEFCPLSSAKIGLVEPEYSMNVRSDCNVISRVARNLLANAFRFARDSVVVTFSKTSDGARVEVKDDGPGIAPEYHAKIFDKYGQAPGSPRKGGTGLGLTFCKLAVELHGGRIGVVSEQGNGCCLWFTLPLAEAETLDARMAS